MSDFTDFAQSLQWLANRAGSYLSGSLGRGAATGKDVDVLVSERTIAALKRKLNEQGVKWDSPFIGCITWYPEGEQVETSTLFPRYKTGPKVVAGVEFRT